MTPEVFHPKFPEIIDGLMPVFGNRNDLAYLRQVASIPLFTDLPEGSKKRAEAEKKYWLQKDKEYNEIKYIYDKYIFVGTKWKGDTEASAVITKINTLHERPYICYRPSAEHIADIENKNKSARGKLPYSHKPIFLKPIAPGTFTLIGFISAIKNKTVNIISVPKEAESWKG